MVCCNIKVIYYAFVDSLIPDGGVRPRVSKTWIWRLTAPPDVISEISVVLD